MNMKKLIFNKLSTLSRRAYNYFYKWDVKENANKLEELTKDWPDEYDGELNDAKTSGLYNTATALCLDQLREYEKLKPGITVELYNDGARQWQDYKIKDTFRDKVYMRYLVQLGNLRFK